MDKPYKIGMYGGKFLPFHKGHNYCVEVAAAECETVYVILFHGSADEEQILRETPRDWLSLAKRTEKLYQMCRANEHLATVIPALIDVSGLRLPDGTEDWDAETPLVRNLLGDQLDAVYSSEVSYGAYFSRAYPEAVHRLVDVPRIHYPISGTEIRTAQGEEVRKRWAI